MIVPRETLSLVTARTMSGVRVALAGLPDVMAVQLAPEVDLQAATVGELRSLTEVPRAITIVIPYRWFDGESVVKIEMPDWIRRSTRSAERRAPGGAEGDLPIHIPRNVQAMNGLAFL